MFDVTFMCLRRSITISHSIAIASFGLPIGLFHSKAEQQKPRPRKQLTSERGGGGRDRH